MKLKKLLSVLVAAVMCAALLPCYASAANTSFSSMTASEFTDKLIVGWNLGNTLDATDGEGLDTETSWGNPKASKKLITTVKKAGFDTVRIPVTWGNHIDSSGKIDSDWLDRVQTVVDYAYDSDMYVILDSHHDKSWITLSEKSYKSVSKKFCYVWRQIAVRFKNYDEHLVFDAMNEPNTEGSEYQWTGGTDAERKVLNKLYADFVKTIRACGGKNSTRFLMIAPYGASAFYDSMKALKIPDDDKIIVSVHAYRPDSISLNTDIRLKKFTQLGKDSIDEAFSDINKAYISKGIPVVMGEFGFLNKGNESECVKAVQYYLKKANSYGIPCCWWDNGKTKTEGDADGFALFDRKTLKQTRSKLKKLTFHDCSVKSLSFAKKLKKLTVIGCGNNGISDISPLSGLTKLEEVWIFDNNISDLTPLVNCTAIKKLDAHNNALNGDLDALMGLTVNEMLNVSGNGYDDDPDGFYDFICEYTYSGNDGYTYYI